MLSSEIKILLLEDDDIDAMAVDRAFKKAGLPAKIQRAKDGLQALDLLPSIEQPFVVLLDLNMPRMNGLEFLSALNQIQSSETIDIFVLTTSNDQSDVEQCQKFNVAGYFLKDTLLASTEVVQTIANRYAANVSKYTHPKEWTQS
jgi:CheY-like chemotaxis protein